MQKEVKEKLGEELIKQIEEKVGTLDDWVSKKDGAYIPREVVDKDKEKLRNQITALEDQLKEQTNGLKELEKQIENGKDATEQIKELQEKNKETEKKYQTELLKLQKEQAIKLKLIENEAIDPELLVGRFDLDVIQPIKGKDGEFTGIDEQIKIFKEETYKNQFGKTVLEGDAPNLEGINPETQKEIDKLNKEYEEAVKKSDLQTQVRLKDKIFELSKKE